MAKIKTKTKAKKRYCLSREGYMAHVERNKRIWETMTPEQKQARTAKMLESRRRNKEAKAAQESQQPDLQQPDLQQPDLQQPDLQQPDLQPTPQVEDDSTVAMILLRDVQKGMALVLGFTPTLVQTMKYLMRCEQDGKVK
jgi:hypothetical protein